MPPLAPRRFPPPWAKLVCATAPADEIASGSRSKRVVRGREAESDDRLDAVTFDPREGGSETYLEPLGIEIQLRLPEGDRENRATGQVEGVGNKVRQAIALEKNTYHAFGGKPSEMIRNTQIHQAIHPEVKEWGGKVNKALLLKFRFRNPDFDRDRYDEATVGGQPPVDVGEMCEFAEM